MRRNALRSVFARRVLPVGLGVAAASCAVLVAAPGAQALSSPATTPFIGCTSDAINQTRGEIDCYTASSFGVGADTWNWTVNYYAAGGNSDELDFICGKGDTYEIGMVIRDSLGDTESGWTSISCRTGIPQ